MKPISQEAFDAKLEQLLGEMSAGAILMIPGVYEAVAEHLNNDVIEALAEDEDAEDEDA